MLGTLKLLENCVKYEARKVVFASTGGAVYGEQRQFPAPEELFDGGSRIESRPEPRQARERPPRPE